MSDVVMPAVMVRVILVRMMMMTILFEHPMADCTLPMKIVTQDRICEAVPPSFP